MDELKKAFQLGFQKEAQSDGEKKYFGSLAGRKPASSGETAAGGAIGAGLGAGAGLASKALPGRLGSMAASARPVAGAIAGGGLGSLAGDILGQQGYANAGADSEKHKLLAGLLSRAAQQGAVPSNVGVGRLKDDMSAEDAMQKFRNNMPGQTQRVS